MTEPVQTIDQADTISDLIEVDELSTAHLTGPNLELEALDANLDTTDWLALLTTRTNVAEAQVDEPPPPQPRPSGMVEHSTPVRMAPTIGSRLTTGFRRGTLLVALAVLAAGALAAGAYVVASTTWLSALLSPSAPAVSQQQATGNAVATGNAGAIGQAQPVTQGNTQAPAQSQSQAQAPANATARELREKGTQQYRAGNFSASVDLLESSVNMDGGDAVSYYQLGLAYMAVAGREHALEDAEMAFRTAVSLQPDWAAPHQLLAESLLRRGFYKEAIAPASEATRLDPSQSDAWMTLGRVYQGAGQQAEATQAFAEAARHAPAPPPAKP